MNRYKPFFLDEEMPMNYPIISDNLYWNNQIWEIKRIDHNHDVVVTSLTFRDNQPWIIELREFELGKAFVIPKGITDPISAKLLYG